MSAADNLHPDLFHATHIMFSPGDVIHAMPHKRIPEDVRAFATTDIQTARGYAAKADKVLSTGSSRRGTPFQGPKQGQLFGHIYKVEPLDPSEGLEHFGVGESQQTTSRKGFRVVQHVESVPSEGVTGGPEEVEEKRRSDEFWKWFREVNLKGKRGSSD